MRAEGDVLLVYFEEKPTVYARLERVEKDRKKGWYQVTLLLLTLPLQEVTWILREDYVDGGPFTMGGKAMRLEAVRRTPSPPRPPVSAPVPKEGRPAGGKGTVIPLRPAR